MTHLFADGGRIVRSTRTDYSEHVGTDDMPEVVRGLMKEQHKAMFVALRSGELDEAIGFDEDESPPTLMAQSATQSAANELVPEPAQSVLPRESKSPGSHAESQRSQIPISDKPYASPRPAAIFSSPSSSRGLFGQGNMDERSLDDAILSYLADKPLPDNK